MSDPVTDPLREEIQQLLVMLACPHEHRTGGNDYLLCLHCDLMWDYRSQQPDAKLKKLVADRLTACLARLEQQEAALQKLTPCRKGHPHYCPNCDNTFAVGGPAVLGAPAPVEPQP